MATIEKRTTKGGATRYVVRVFVGREPTTDRQRFVVKTFERWKDAAAEGRRLERMKDQAALVVPSKDPLAVYLRRWLEDVMRGRVRPRTWDGYDGVLRRYLEEPPAGAPPVGVVRLDRVTPEGIQALYRWMQREQALSPSTVRSLHAVLRQGLAYAARTGAAARNVADLVELPKQDRREVVAMTSEQAARFLECARADRYHALWLVLLTGGLRPGEALGLKWEDLDADAGKLHVQRALVRRGHRRWTFTEPKTSAGRRVVVLPAFALEALRSWKATQAREALQLGAEYERHGLMFTTHFGRPLALENLSRRNFRRIMAAAELGAWEQRDGDRWVPWDGVTKRRRFRPAFRLYDLRHTAATLLLRAGVHPKAVSERLGHAKVAFTLDVYSASLPDLQEGAAAKLEVMFGSK